jgi:hypothetical protein
MKHFVAACLLTWCAIVFATRGYPAEPAARPATATATKPAEPWCNHVAHAPKSPKSGDPVKIAASIAADITAATLQYQIVDPGAYIEFHDREYAKNWIAIPMQAAQTANGRTPYTATLPGDLQKHRRLIRYRIVGKGADGKSIVSPLTPTAETDSPLVPSNYAYFVYDAIPPWKGAINPSSNDPDLSRVTTFTPEALGRIQVYQLLGKKSSIENVTWIEQMPGRDYKYTGTLVIGDQVFDHVRYRARGGIWRYALGKNMWKIDLPAGEHMHLKDDRGKPYAASWNKLNLRSVFQLGAYGHRGEQGMFEEVNFRLFALAGVDAPYCHWIHFRIVDEKEEAPADQYKGDFWGLYLVIENEDGRFLKNHNMPDGNIFKMAMGTGELNHRGEGQPGDRSDMDKFLETYNTTRPTDKWWRENLDLDSYFSYRAILECVHHYDIGEGKNYDYYHNPKTGQWQVIPWDVDLSWADRMFGDGEEPFHSRVLFRRAFYLEYQNRLREIRDLLFNPQETHRLIEEVAAIIQDPAHEAADLLEADRRKWDYHPQVTEHRHAGQGRFYQAAPTHDFAGMVQLMKDYVVTRSRWVDATLLRDPKIPTTPTIEFTGAETHPANQLKFSPGDYEGANAFAAAKWRIAEVTPRDAPVTTARLYEITAAWQSDELKSLGDFTLPAKIAKPGHLYRVRLRVKDSTGRWSHWSAPIEFEAAKPSRP